MSRFNVMPRARAYIQRSDGTREQIDITVEFSYDRAKINFPPDMRLDSNDRIVDEHGTDLFNVEALLQEARDAQ